MTDKVVVFVACENSAQAEKIAESLVREKLCACVTVVPGVRSCFVWEGKLTWSDEVLAVIKTSSGRFGQLVANVRKVHGYKVPEIVSVPIEDGLQEYLDWIDRSVGAAI